MPAFSPKKISSIKSPEEFRSYTQSLGVTIPCSERIVIGNSSPLCQPVENTRINGKIIGNRWAIQPMEGWDGTPEGGVTPDALRRWGRFGESGAKLIWGEAMAICPEGRANPNQLILTHDNLADLKQLKKVLIESHRASFGNEEDLVVGFQLTHSGRFCRPLDKKQLQPCIAYRHPVLDGKFGITSDTSILRDENIPALIGDYVRAAAIAQEAGADFIDLKHCHGYLLHEFLTAHDRLGPYGGNFINRTRLLREIVRAIRAANNPIEIGVRLSSFDFVPFRPDPTHSSTVQLRLGQPEPVTWPYRFSFGGDANTLGEVDLTEPLEFLRLCHTLGIRLINLTAGSPYYNPHIQRPAYFPPSDGYAPPHDPLVDVARQMRVVKELKSLAPQGMVFVGSAYSYLQEFLPSVAQAAVAEGWTDIVGIGRMSLSYPRCIADAVIGRPPNNKLICRTLSDCTTAPRNGLPSGCYPLDPHYAAKPEASRLKKIKRGVGTD